jgi:hypothetical protein
MSALGQKQTFAPENVMSALPLCIAYVRFGSKADIPMFTPCPLYSRKRT